MNDPFAVRVIVPTFNGGGVWGECARALARSRLASRHHVEIEVVDSSSSDDTAGLARDYGLSVTSISPACFDHGGTRNRAAFKGDNPDVLVFLTQDAILQGAADLDRLVQAFNDPLVAVAYGRQIPQRNANPIAAHARLFNYPSHSHRCTLADKHSRGIKAAFTSNSFAAYRYSVFRQLGGFPEKTVLSEDMYFAAHALQAGHAVAYVGDAVVRHSHNYTPRQEFCRYFDIGVFHHDEKWITAEFGGAAGEGKRFLLSELRYLLRHAPLWIPRACVHNALKIAGYKLGKHHSCLPTSLKPRLSMNSAYWRR